MVLLKDADSVTDSETSTPLSEHYRLIWARDALAMDDHLSTMEMVVHCNINMACKVAQAVKAFEIVIEV